MDPDALLMDLVDEVLATGAQDREAVYVEIRERHPDLYAEVRDRVEWEERMGGFLCEPVMAVEPVRASPGRWALAGAAVVLATLAVCFWAGGDDVARPELLIILPGPPGSLGAGEEVAERLGVIGPGEALRQGVDTPELARVMLGIGHSVRATAKPKELIDAIRRELHLRSRAPRAPVNQAAYSEYAAGLALLRADPAQREAATVHLRRAVELDPRSAAARMRLAEAAGGEASDGAGMRSDFYGYWVVQGGQCLERGDPSKAEQAYRRAIELAPGVADAHAGLGLALVRQHRYPEAEAALLESLGLKRSRETLRHLGELYAAQGRLAEAARLQEEAGAR